MTARRRLASSAAALALLAALTASASAAPTRWSVRSPDGRLAATVTQPRAGTPLRIELARDGRALLGGQLGLLTSRGPLVRGLTPTGVRRGRVAQIYRTPTGKRRLHRYAARALTVSFRRGALRMRLRVQVSDDGVAYRYELPGRGALRIVGERSSFAAPAGARAWLQRYASNYEGPYDATPLRAAPAGRYGFPALLWLGRGAWALLTESGVTDQAAAHLTTSAVVPGVLHVVPQGATRAQRPFVTPWRVAVLGDLGTIVASDLPTSLGGRSQIADTSWIRPGRVAWSWWSDRFSPASYERQQAFVDFAASFGWEYVTVDEGWDASWMPQLVAYARQRGVGILLWARWSDVRTPAEQAAAFDQWRSWGVAGVKLDFPQSDGQARMAWYDAVARSAAQRHLLVDFHGCTVPRGIQRRWPNVLTMEAVLGAENYRGVNPAMTPAHNTTLPFTRNAIGSMDYTPVTFSATRRGTTAGHELALAVVFESGLQHFADGPPSYTSRPLAADVLRRVPVAWDDTRPLAGYPGRDVTLARRRGASWWIGSISAR
ncbi:MAG: glycoside hydrolase family 97 catalytic domain-containing protein, partial [Conexibacter sp.]